MSIIHSLETSHQHDSKQSNDKKSERFTFDSNSFAAAKKKFSIDESSTTKQTDKHGSSDVASSTKSTCENTKPERNLDALKKEILALYGPKNDVFSLPAKISKNEETASTAVPSTGQIGMGIFGNKSDTVKPSFSFNFPENNDLFANGNGVKPTKPAETGIYIKNIIIVFCCNL